MIEIHLILSYLIFIATTAAKKTSKVCNLLSSPETESIKTTNEILVSRNREKLIPNGFGECKLQLDCKTNFQQKSRC